jgi:hypothetical protein
MPALMIRLVSILVIAAATLTACSSSSEAMDEESCKARFSKEMDSWNSMGRTVSVAYRNPDISGNQFLTIAPPILQELHSVTADMRATEAECAEYLPALPDLVGAYRELSDGYRALINAVRQNSEESQQEAVKALDGASERLKAMRCDVIAITGDEPEPDQPPCP